MADSSGLGLEALAPNGLKGQRNYTIGTFPRDRVSPRMAAVLDRLSRDPVVSGLSVKSATRTVEENRRVGGARNSQHIYGNALDARIRDLPPSQRTHVLNKMVEAGVSRFGLYTSGAFHFDVRPGVGLWGALKSAAYSGMTAAQLGKLPEWARATITGLFSGTLAPSTTGLPTYQNNLFENRTEIQRQLPYQTTALPTSREQGLLPSLSPAEQRLADQYAVMGASKAVGAEMARQASVTAAYGNPSRSLDVVPDPGLSASRRAREYAAYRSPSAADLLGLTQPSRTNPAPQPGLNMPSRPTTTNPPSRFAAVPVGPVTRSPLGAVPASFPSARPSVPAARPTAAPRPAVDSILSGPLGLGASANALSASTARNVAAMNAPTQAADPRGFGTAPASPQGNFSAPTGPSTADLAAQYSQYRTPTSYEQVRQKMAAIPAPAITPTVAPPTSVLAPELAPPKVIKELPVFAPPVVAPSTPTAPRAPVAPSLRPSDIYAGAQGTALDSAGNTIGRDAYGNTTVTNEHGKTTAMTPGGYQSAYGGAPGGGTTGGSLFGDASLPGISGPTSKTKSAALSFGLAAAGGYLGGPVGAIAGGLLGKAVAPGGILSGTRNIDTSNIGTIAMPNGQMVKFGATTAFSRPQGGLAFPDRPSTPAGARNQRGFDSRADRDHARGISPAAARDIDRGRTGLY